jgi:transposase
MKFSFRRLRKSLKTKQDPEEYVRLEEELDTLLFLEKEGYINVYFGDESGFDLDPSIPYGWQPIGTYKGIVPQNSKRRNVFGLLSTKNHFVGYDVIGSINSDLIIEFMDDFVKEITQKTIIVLDNATIHKSKAFQKRREVWEAQDVYIWYLPTYSPHLNRIETLWRKIKYEWLRPNDYLNWNTLNNAIDEILANIGRKYAIAFA